MLNQSRSLSFAFSRCPLFYGGLPYPLAIQASDSRVAAAVWAINTVCLVSFLAVSIKHWMAVADYSRAPFPYTCWVGEIQVNSRTVGSMSGNGDRFGAFWNLVSPWMNGGINRCRGESVAPSSSINHVNYVERASQWFMDQSVFLRSVKAVWTELSSSGHSSSTIYPNLWGLVYLVSCLGSMLFTMALIVSSSTYSISPSICYYCELANNLILW